jgi:hypothetical protein
MRAMDGIPALDELGESSIPDDLARAVMQEDDLRVSGGT